jgi:hypothetical protein
MPKWRYMHRSAQLRWLPNFLVQEHNEVNDRHENGQTWIGKGFLKAPFVLDADGCVAVPQAPRLGIEIDEAGLREIMQQPWSAQREQSQTRFASRCDSACYRPPRGF